MTNYEKYKTEIDIILDKNTFVAVDRNTNKLATCRNLSCEDCLFFRKHNDGTNCDVNAFKWLVAEYKEPEIDWSKVPIDTPVLVRYGNRWLKRHFAGVDDNGQPTAWNLGVTSWSEENALRLTSYADIKLAEVK